MKKENIQKKSQVFKIFLNIYVYLKMHRKSSGKIQSKSEQCLPLGVLDVRRRKFEVFVYLSLLAHVCVLCVLWCSVVSDFLRPLGLQPTSSSVHGIFQARILEWVDIFYSRRSSRDSEIESTSPMSPAQAGGYFTTEPPRKPMHEFISVQMPFLIIYTIKTF